MGKKKVPISAGNPNISKTPKAAEYDYQSSHPCWRFSMFDKDGPWGLKNLKRFTFLVNDNILEEVVKLNNEELYNTLNALEGKEFFGFNDFLGTFSKLYTDQLPLQIVKAIENSLSYSFFEKIYPKLLSFESMSWDEIRQQTHRRGNTMVSNNHDDDISKLGKTAQLRLKELGYTDYDKIYSLRLEGKIRIFGFRTQNYMDIVWVDLDHSVYPLKNK